MRNRILFITRNTIPYIKELQPIAGSVAACILMQQLDYWFERFPDGFWKFLEPSGHLKFRKGDSWTEELGLSAEEFRTAFDKIGTRFKSKGLYDQADDKFQGKYYCSYLNRVENLTYYFRNHMLTDMVLDELIMNNKNVATVNQEQRFTVSRESKILDMGGMHLQGSVNPSSDITEITFSEITHIPPQPPTDNDLFCNSGESKIIFPAQLIEEEKIVIWGLMRHLQLDTQQKLLAELEGHYAFLAQSNEHQFLLWKA